jgi:hypothetical protein
MGVRLAVNAILPGDDSTASLSFAITMRDERTSAKSAPTMRESGYKLSVFASSATASKVDIVVYEAPSPPGRLCSPDLRPQNRPTHRFGNQGIMSTDFRFAILACERSCSLRLPHGPIKFYRWDWISLPSESKTWNDNKRRCILVLSSNCAAAMATKGCGAG